MESSPDGPTILLVDDDPELLLLWRLTVNMDGGFGTVLVAENGMDALDVIEHHPGVIDAVLTDCHMPHGSGFAVVDAAREWHPDAVTVMASSARDIRDEALRRGVTAFLTKPQSVTEQMPALLHALLSERAALEGTLNS